jgi:uracil-DNA glycosylase
MDAWDALRLQFEFGADEALDLLPLDRLVAAGAPPIAPAPVRGAPAPLARPASRADPGQLRPGGGTVPLAPTSADALAAAADSLPALREAIARFEGCALSATAANLVFVEGDPAAGLLLIGEAPSDADDRAGRPFAGPAGDYLDRMLASIGLDRSRLLLSPLVPWRPPGDRPPSAGERAACRPFLDRLIVLVRPRLIVLLGPLAAQDLLGGGVGRRAGRSGWRPLTVPTLDPIPALASQDPGFLLRNPGPARRRAWADLRLLRRALDGEITKM